MDDKNQALKFASRILNIRKRSVLEIRKRLRQKKIEEKIINEIIEEFKKYGYLNDEEFAEAYINDRMNFNPRGNFLIRKELQGKGVAKNIIDEKIKELFPEEKEIELAKKTAEKKLEGLDKNLDRNKIYQKIGSYLQTKGYGSWIIREVLEDIK